MDPEIDWNEIVEDLGPRLYRYFCARFNQQSADDLTQETLVRLVRKVNTKQFDPDRGTLKMLAFGIAHYVALESRNPVLAADVDDFEILENIKSETNFENDFIRFDLASKVRHHFDKLSEIEQQILALFIDQDLMLIEISLIVQMPQGTVKSHVFRAKNKLIQILMKENVI
jgi:RNA polymerase sigma factor (sigma-70 family)